MIRIEGTVNIIDAMKKNNVKRLIVDNPIRTFDPGFARRRAFCDTQ